MSSNFDAKAFASDFDKDPALGKLENLRKAELLQVGQELSLRVNDGQKKAEIKQNILEHFVEREILDRTVLEQKPNVTANNEVELARLRYEYEIKMKELELKFELEHSRAVHTEVNKEFDVGKNIRLVPSFNDDVDKYFLHFEKIATQCKWPKQVWTIMLQSVLKGKAQEVYAALDVNDSGNYETVKAAILNAYELVPESYRQKFRQYKKSDDLTHVEFARQKEAYFDRWCKSMKVKTHEELRQLMLVEEFKRQCTSEVHTFLDEKNVTTLAEAARLADGYSVTHVVSSRSKHDKKKDHVVTKVTSQTSIDNVDTKDGTGKKSGTSQGKMCAYCKKPGHVIGECYRLQKKNQQKDSKPAALTSTLQNTTSSDSTGDIPTGFQNFVTTGFVSLTPDGDKQPVKILRDTAALQSLLLAGTLTFVEPHQDTVLVRGIGGYQNAPLHEVYLNSELVKGKVSVGVLPDLPVPGVTLLLGNDLAGDRVHPPYPVMAVSVCDIMKDISDTGDSDSQFPELFPGCAVTRAMTKKMDTMDKTGLFSDLSDTFMKDVNDLYLKVDIHGEVPDEPSQPQHKTVGREQLILEQKRDPELQPLFHKAVSKDAIAEDAVCYYTDKDVLMRKWRDRTHPSDEWMEVHQIVVPKVFRGEILKLGHDAPMAGHLGVRKTLDRVRRHFYWPTIDSDVRHYCKTCETCQLVGKPNQTIPNAPLRPIPAFEEPFSRIIIDCVGPLPKTRSGHEYLLTIMDAATRFPEAVPLRKITATAVTRALVKFFTLVGLPKVVQSDQGSNFTSKVFGQVMKELGIEHVTSSAYHPQSQGALERYHQTLKNMLRCYCMDQEKDWDEGVPMLLFATREVVQESLGFSPFDLVFGHAVRGPLMLLKEQWLDDDVQTDLLSYVSAFRERLQSARETARTNLEHAQLDMKTWYDRNSVEREFQVGDKVLAMLPIPGSPLKARFYGPYVISRRVGDLDYELLTPGRRKAKQLCHVNMLKLYHERDAECVVNAVVNTDSAESEPCEFGTEIEYSVKIDNSKVLEKLDSKLCHLPSEKKKELCDLMSEYPKLFTDQLSQTDVVFHDVDVGEAKPIKQHPYRVSPYKREKLAEEVKFMLQNELIEPSNSDWSSPCILVPKSDNTYRFCTDYRKVNSVTKTDSFPIPRMEDCVDRVGGAKYVSKFDLMKGFWQVPLTPRAVEVSAFVTPDGLYSYRVMPFGMKNSGATFQRLMNSIIYELEGVDVYVDDLVVMSDTWEQHIMRLRALFDRLTKAKLTVNLAKCEFAQAQVCYLGHLVGGGQVKPTQAKVEAIVNFPEPRNKRELMRFLGMAGYYRKFCKNFATVCHPLTSLLSKDVRFAWSEECRSAFEAIKAILSNEPVLMAPDFSKEFSLYVDASDVGSGAVLQQTGEDGVVHPVCYFSKKFSGSQTRYSTIEKEALSLVWAMNHFNVYLCDTPYPVQVFTDNNPLTFIARMKNKNQRVTRWSLILQEYNIEIKHVRGKDNLVADALSRV